MRLGVDYYPEHWNRDRWNKDVELMREAGITFVRLAEFAWSRLEPSEGVYNFSWLDEVIALLGKNGIEVALGTPTAAPPAWIFEKHPDIFPVDADGHRLGFGARLHRCLNNPRFRGYSRAITQKLAEHYRDCSYVTTWQTDNEFEGNRCYCSECTKAFHKWLRNKYASLDRLNSRWGTVFWSQEYTSWDQIPLPNRIKCGQIAHNPSLILDYYRFASDSTVEFQKEQIKILRNITPNKKITHNYMGFHNTVDYYDLSRDLDVISWDNYPVDLTTSAYECSLNAAMAHDLMRGTKEKNFWIMEERSGPTGWDRMSNTTRPGQIRMWTYQAIGHGADLVSYFRWRSCLYGTEQYWHGILNHDGTPRRRYREVQQIGEELKGLLEELECSVVQNEVAIIHQYDQNWALQIQPQTLQGIEYWGLAKHVYSALTKLGVGIDIVSADTNFSKYKIIMFPMLSLVDEELTEKIEEYVLGGGKVILTPRTGVKNKDNVAWPLALPGLLRKCSGIEIEEYDAINHHTNQIQTEDGARYQVSMWCDMLRLETATALASYTQDFYAGWPAISENRYGKGMVWYFGTFPEDRFFTDFMTKITCGLRKVKDLPEGVLVSRRGSAEYEYLFFINTTALRQAVRFEREHDVLLFGDSHSDGFELEPYGVQIARCVKKTTTSSESV